MTPAHPTERRADTPMIARIDERTLNMAEDMKAILEWQIKHQQDDDARGDRITSLETSRTWNKAVTWTLGFLAGFLGVDKIVGLLK